jgi:hypothetical protein
MYFKKYLNMSKFVIIGDTKFNLNDVYDKGLELYLIANNPKDVEYPSGLTFISEENALDFYKKNNLEYYDGHITFVDCTGFSKNYLDVMYMLQTGRLDKRSYYVGGKTLKISNYPQIKHYNIFQGEAMSDTISKTDKEAVRSMISTYIEIIKEYLKAGFHERKILDVPSGWTLNLATKELCLLVYHYDLFPDAPDFNPTGVYDPSKYEIVKISPIIEYMHNSQYRKVVLDGMIALVANFLVRNDYISVGDIEDYYDLKSWKTLSKKL